MKQPISTSPAGRNDGFASELAQQKASALAIREHSQVHLLKKPKKTVKAGRPTAYAPWMAEKAFRILADPDIVASMAYVAACLGISRDTLWRWSRDRDTKPQFSDAIAWGMAIQEVQLATMLRSGFKDSKNIVFILKNLHRWKDRAETQSELDVGALIREIEQGAPRVDWDRESVTDTEDMPALP